MGGVRICVKAYLFGNPVGITQLGSYCSKPCEVFYLRTCGFWLGKGLLCRYAYCNMIYLKIVLQKLCYSKVERFMKPKKLTQTVSKLNTY